MIGSACLGTIGGTVGGFIAPTVCGAIGVPSAGMGALVCVVVIGGLGGMVGGKLGSMGGEELGRILYEEAK